MTVHGPPNERLERDLPRETRILRLMPELGPDIPAIASRTGIPKESVRYVYKRHVLGNRMKLKREIDLEKLGLHGIQFLLRFAPETGKLLEHRRGGILSDVWESLYVQYIYRTLPEGLYFIGHLAPPETHQRLRDFYAKLESMGLCQVIETYDASRLRHSRMWVELFDFDRQGWDFDWDLSRNRPVNVDDLAEVHERAKFDKLDLRIVQLLQTDGTRDISSISAELKENLPTVFRHWRKHVLGRGLFNGWRIDWLGTTKDMKTGKIPIRRSGAAINTVVKGLTPVELMNLRAQLHSIPYLWSEQIGPTGDFNAESLMPVHSLMEAFEFLAKVFSPLGARARVLIIDQSSAINYMINPELFDQESRSWVWKGDLVLRGIEQLLVEYSGLFAPGRKSQRESQG